MNKLKRSGHIFTLAFTLFTFVLVSVAPAFAAADMTTQVVAAVTITGNSAIAEKDILAATKVKVGENFDKDKVKEDMQAIYNLGFFFDVVANFKQRPEGMEVIYSVMENPKVNEVIVAGNTKVPTDKIQSLLGVKLGEVLNTKQLNDNVRVVENYYHDQGFILSKVTDVKMENGGKLNVKLNEGIVEDIVIKGNEKTREYVIAREFKLKEGQPFNVKEARKSMQNLYNLGYFEDVNVKLTPGALPNGIVVDTTVKEQKTGNFSIGAGYSESDGMVGIFSLSDNNFRGKGDKARIEWEFGGDANENNFELSYTRPWLDSKKTSLGVTIYNATNQYNEYENGNFAAAYDRKRKGWELTLGRPVSESSQNYITLKDRKDTFAGWDEDEDNHFTEPEKTAYIKDNFGRTRSLSFMNVYDTRDNVFNPTEGERTSISAEFAGNLFGGDFDYQKYTAEGRKYFKVGDDKVIATKMQLGYSNGKLPESAMFAVGGAETLRGYEDDQFEGDKMFSLSAEYRFPVVKKVHGVLFVDAANAWESSSIDITDLKTSVGAGLRINTPIGPIKLDYGYGEEGGKTHFSFGGQF